jgi:hypothetical protein
MEINSEIIAMRYAQALLRGVPCPKDINLAVRIGSCTAFLELYKYRLARADLCLYEKLMHVFSLEEFRIDLLIKLLAAHGRISIFPDVMRHIFELYKKQNQFLFCTIKTSHELSANQKEVVATFVSKAAEKEIVFSVIIDRNLIAGIRVEGDEMVWESSVAHQLRAIEQLQ